MASADGGVSRREMAYEVRLTGGGVERRHRTAMTPLMSAGSA